MTLTDEQTQLYRQTLEISKKQVGELNAAIEEELAKVKDRLALLQSQKNAAKQIHAGACAMLGIDDELQKAEEAEA